VPTVRQQRGSSAEDVAAGYLVALGWTVVARNRMIGAHDEIDLVAVDVGGELVCVEVRSARSPHFGAPEERVDRRKVGHLYRAAQAFARSPEASALGVGGRSVRVDLIVVDVREGKPAIRHLPRLEPV
jgi:putative endonuclease